VRLYKSFDGSSLDWDWVEPVSYGYDSDGRLMTIMALAQYQGRVRLIKLVPRWVGGKYMIEDLMDHYSASAIPGTTTENPEED